MRNVLIGEWILGLVTSRDRAASTVGDLMEQRPAQGVFPFWFGIWRIAASLLWRGFAENPVRITGVAFAGLAVDIVTSLFLAFLSGLLFFAGAYNSNHVEFNSGWWTIWLDMPALLISVLIGRMLARWAPGRELSACLAYAILGSLFSLMMMLAAPGGLSPSALLWAFLGDVAQRTPVLAGAAWGRHRRLAAFTPGS